MRRVPARPVRACFVRTCCTVVVQEHDLRRTPVQCNSKRTLSSHFTLRSSHPALHTSHLHFISSQIMWALLTSPHLISALLISSHLFSHVIQVSSSQLFSSHPSTDQPVLSPRSSSQRTARQKALTVRVKSLARKNHWAQKAFASRSLRHRCVYRKAFAKYFVLQSLHKELPNTTLYYNKACAKHSPVLLCTTKLAQSTSQYFVLQSLHKALPSTTVLLQSSHQYYFVPQILHKALPSTTLYYRACTK